MMQSAFRSRVHDAIASRWRAEFGVYSAMDADSAAIRARHLQSIGKLTPLLMTGNLTGAVLLCVSLGSTLPSWQVLPWLALMVLLFMAAMHNWWTHRARRRTEVSPQATAAVVRNASALALLWAAATAAWLPHIAHEQQLLLSTLVVGIMCGGAFGLASVPQAATAYVALMTIGSMIGLARSGGMVYAHLMIMVLLYAILLCLSVLTNARIYTARLASERDAERQGEFVGLLLRDFEDYAADLLWETGPDGVFTRASARLAAVLGIADEQMLSLRLLDVLDPDADPGHEGAGTTKLRDAMAGGRPFRDLVVPARTTDGLRWWSVTAKPQLAAGSKPGAWRGVITDVTATRLAHERLEQLAHFDPLTGLANRWGLRERLKRAAHHADGKGGHRLAFVCLDVDHFKSVNDVLGHGGGDAVLVEVAQRLRAALRQGDVAARLGGDEFALIFEGVQDVEQLHAIARRLVSALRQPFAIDGTPVPISVSVGAAMAPEHGTGLDELLGNADLALYAAKAAGRGRHEIFSPAMGCLHRRRLVVTQALDGALERGEFDLAWQPQVRIEDSHIVGAEVLLRWCHPELGTVPPAEFIPIAEETGRLHAIGAWVLDQACTGAVDMPASFTVSVNASAVQLMREDFVAIVGSAINRSGLPARQLKVEVTESLFMDAAPVALGNLHGLRRMGVQIALDDFGTGYSSLAYLLRFPFNVLKIDRAFVLELMARDDARALVRSIVEMARALGMGTIAEGVEDGEQLEILRQAGCDAVQGYFIARPMPLATLRRLCAEQFATPLLAATSAATTAFESTVEALTP